MSLKERELLDQMREALAGCTQDIREWLQLAANHRKHLGDKANFEPYCPTSNGISKSEAVLRKAALAFIACDKLLLAQEDEP